MRLFGLKPLPAFLAAAGVYAIGALIYGLLFAQQWMTLSGYTEASFKGNEWRMALSPLMPILIVLGIGILMKQRQVSGLIEGFKIGAFVGIFFLIPARLYIFVYGIEPLALLGLDCAHLFLNGAVAGAILGAMKAVD
jgi:Protein of unknown function (DUF1761)